MDPSLSGIESCSIILEVCFFEISWLTPYKFTLYFKGRCSNQLYLSEAGRAVLMTWLCHLPHLLKQGSAHDSPKIFTAGREGRRREGRKYISFFSFLISLYSFTQNEAFQNLLPGLFRTCGNKFDTVLVNPQPTQKSYVLLWGFLEVPRVFKRGIIWGCL